jgi:hypothetical protein
MNLSTLFKWVVWIPWEINLSSNLIPTNHKISSCSSTVALGATRLALGTYRKNMA